jgi:FtsZ-interacting cell division protein ZipA
MNKYVVGGILGAISLLVIFGASASNRVARWVDSEEAMTTSLSSNTAGANTVSAQSNRSGSTRLVSLNETGTTTQTNTNLTPMQKAGELPQRQTLIEADRTTEVRTTAAPTTTTSPQTTTTQANTTTNQGTTSQPAPTTAQSRPAAVPALW